MEYIALHDEREIAARLHISVSTLRNWRVSGRGPAFVKIGKRAVRYRWADVEAFLATGQRAGGAK